MKTETPSRYQSVSAVKASGSTYTPPALATFVAEQVASLVAELRQPGTTISVLDPAVGDGELLVQMVEALRGNGFTRVRVKGFDLDGAALTAAQIRLAESGIADATFTQADFLSAGTDASTLGSNLGPLFSHGAREKFDVIIANPPYVRTQILGGEIAQELAQRHGLTGRVDLYQAFMVMLSDWLQPAGVAGLITSNRFLTVKAGEAVRRHIWRAFRVHHVWDLGDTKCFGAAVLPAVTLLEKEDNRSGGQGDVRMTSVYETRSASGGVTVGNLFEALAEDGIVSVGDGRRFDVRQGTVESGPDGSEVWRLSNPAVTQWLDQVAERTWKVFGEVGKIRVGIKTTADSVFIGDEWEADPRGVPELLRPLTTHHIGRRYKAQPTQKSVLYTHEVVNGKSRVVDLAAYPVAAAYLEPHRERLAGRKYVAKANRNWYEIWVPQDPSEWPRPKLVFRDITDEPQFWVDLSGTVINGDCYWMTTDDGEDDLLWLAVAVGNSRFICDFYDRRFNNKLYAGRRRFITQYVKHFPLPDPELPSCRELIRLARSAYAVADSGELGDLQVQLDSLVAQSFGVSVEEATR